MIFRVGVHCITLVGISKKRISHADITLGLLNLSIGVYQQNICQEGQQLYAPLKVGLIGWYCTLILFVFVK